MNLYLVWQEENNGYDTYDSFVVCAKSKKNAIKIHPSEYTENWNGKDNFVWCDIEYVQVKLIGIASRGIKENSIICASFNAG